MAQSWQRLLFAHWPLAPEALRPLIPEGLALDTFDGAAWLGIVPFEMRHVRLRGLPELPLLSMFPELNVRTYVVRDGLPGVWFFSLDADHRPAVLTARALFHLPYFKAEMRVEQHGEAVRYRSRRQEGSPAEFQAEYRPTGPVFHSRAGSLEHWLTERYYLYATDRHGAMYRGAVHHGPWPLQPASAAITVNTVAGAIALPGTAPLLHYAQSIDVVGWAIERI
jgi:uncharacterized protein YqjF (DUF2071 family)